MNKKLRSIDEIFFCSVHKTTPMSFWSLDSKNDQKICVTLTPRAASWLKTVDGTYIKRFYNEKTGHSQEHADELASKCQLIAKNISCNKLNTTYSQGKFPGHMYPKQNPVESLPGCIKGYLLEDTDDIDMKQAMDTVLRGVCAHLGRPMFAECDRSLIATEAGVSAAEAKLCTNIAWTAEKQPTMQSPSYNEYCREVDSRRAWLVHEKELDHIRQHVQQLDKTTNKIGTFASYVYAFVMGKILHQVKLDLTKAGAKVQLLCKDGLRVTKNLPHDMLIDVAVNATKKVLNINSHWTVKEHSSEISDSSNNKTGVFFEVDLTQYNASKSTGPTIASLNNAELMDMKTAFHTWGVEWKEVSEKPDGIQLHNFQLSMKLAEGTRTFEARQILNIVASGEEWETRDTRPNGQELKNDLLLALLDDGQLSFTTQELKDMDLTVTPTCFLKGDQIWYTPIKLAEDHYIKDVCGAFFVPLNSLYSYTYCKKLFERRFVKADDVFIDKVELHGYGNNPMIPLRKLEMKYGDLKFANENGDDTPFLSVYKHDQNKISFDSICFVPPTSSRDTTGFFNMFTPFKGFTYDLPQTREEARKYLTTIITHIKMVMGANDPFQFKFFMQFLAQMVQFPHNKSVFPVICGLGGAGKSTTMKLVREIIGASKFLSTSTPELDVWGQFNAGITNKFFIEFSEVNKANFFQSQGRVKQILEDDQIQVQQKHVDSKTIWSYHHGCVCTNNMQPVFEDRRWAPIHVSEHMCIPKYCDDCSDGICEACKTKKDYHTETNTTFVHPPAVRIFTEMLTYLSCPEKLTADHVPESELSDLVREGSYDMVDHALTYLVKKTLEREPAANPELYSMEHLFDEYRNYMQKYEKAEELGLSQFRNKVGCKQWQGMTKRHQSREYRGTISKTPQRYTKINFQELAKSLNVEVGGKSAIVEALRPKRQRKIDAEWGHAFQNTEEWIDGFLNLIYEEPATKKQRVA